MNLYAPTRDVRLRRVDARAEQRLKKLVYAHLQSIWPSIYRSARNLRKQSITIDWKGWQYEFDRAMLAEMLPLGGDYASAEAQYFKQSRGVEFQPDEQAVFGYYEVGAQARLKDVGETTARNVQLILAAWPTEWSVEEVTKRLAQWFSRDRAKLIAITEMAELSSAASRWSFGQAHVGRWLCVGSKTMPCVLCERNAGITFTMRDKFPPFHPGCTCKSHPVG